MQSQLKYATDLILNRKKNDKIIMIMTLGLKDGYKIIFNN